MAFRHFGRSVIGLALVASGLGLAGCGRTDSSEEAITAASQALYGLGSFDTVAAPSAQRRTQVYTSVLSGLGTVVSDDAALAGQKSAARLLMARAHAGLAEVDLARASELDRRSIHQVTAVRALLDRWSSQGALRAALLQDRPDQELASINAQISATDEEIAQARVRRAEIDRQIADLESRASAALGRGIQAREQAATIYQQAEQADPIRRATLVEQAAGLKRTGAGHDREAADLQAQAAQLAPASAELGRLIDGLQRQKERLAQLAAGVQDRARASQQQAERLAGETRATAQAIQAAVAELGQLRAGELVPAYDKAVQAYRKAFTEARSGAEGVDGETRTAARLASASHALARGDALASRARGQAAYASLLEAIARAEPPLPERSSYASQAAEARASAEALTQEARAALEEAKQAFEGAGVRGEEAERQIEVITTTLGDLASGRLAAEFAAVAGAGGGEAETIRALIGQAVGEAAEGRFGALRDLVHAPTPPARQTADALIGLMEQMAALDRAMMARFGQGMEETMGGSMSMGGLGGGFGSFADLDPAALVISVEGDSAVATLPDGPAEPVAFVKVDGRWRLDLLGAAPPEAAAMLSMMAPMLGSVRGAMETLAQRVEAGEFESADAVAQELMQQMQRTMGPLMGGGG